MEVKDFESGELLTTPYLTLYSIDRTRSVYLHDKKLNHQFREALMVDVDDERARELYEARILFSPTVQITLGFLHEDFLKNNLPNSLKGLEARLVSV